MSRVKVCTFVDSDLRDQFERHFGGYGSLSYVLETAMSEVLSMVAHDPPFDELIRQGIRTHVLRNKLKSQDPE